MTTENVDIGVHFVRLMSVIVSKRRIPVRVVCMIIGVSSVISPESERQDYLLNAI